ncbi:MAG TPA: hypothetical protein VFD84_06550 [Candidatus Binatia bacterium]|nr:hypothetical protein [Candidatus Binatia bacterium]
MTSAGASVLGASREERALYAELLAVYRELVAALADPARPLDHGWLAGRHAAAETLTARLRAVATELAPHRLSGAPVAAEVAELWRGSAALAAEAARVNAEATALARARQTALLARLAALDAGRRALAGYRPAAAAVRAGQVA